MKSEYSAAVKQDGKSWISWVEEIPAVNCQEDSRQELTLGLQDAVREGLDFNRREAREAAGEGYPEIALAV